jgi:hypothetical protein
MATPGTLKQAENEFLSRADETFRNFWTRVIHGYAPLVVLDPSEESRVDL